MDIGFTGTRNGMTEAQKATVRNIVAGYWHKTLTAHHGCCVGADTEFHAICKSFGVRVVGHPAYPEGHEMRGVSDSECDEVRDIMPPLDRNKIIVNESLQLIATPSSMEINPRSGTGSTVNYSRKLEKARVVVYPDGRGDSELKRTSMSREAFALDTTRYGGV